MAERIDLIADTSAIIGLLRRQPTLTPAIYARIYFDLERRGTMIPINDDLDCGAGD